MTFDARWYSLLHTGSENDEDYYVQAVQGTARVLELGCGFGRITLPIAKSGVSVVGVDNSPGMLALLAEKLGKLKSPLPGQVDTVLADMRALPFDTRFDRVLIPYNGLLCLLDDTAVSECLRGAATLLNPGGELHFDIYDVPSDYDEEAGGEGPGEFEFITAFSYRRKWVEVFERPLNHSDPKRLDVEYRYQWTDARGRERLITTYAIPQRCIYEEEIPYLLSRAGFEDVTITGDFGDGPVTDDTEQLTVRARL